jgi:CubicO group peptidase (beta-lactamase class C family)
MGYLPACLVCLLLVPVPVGNSWAGGDYVYQVPEQLDDGWQVSSLSDEGMDEQLIAKLTNQIMEGKYKGIHSIVLLKNGKLVHEAYFDGYSRDSLHKIFSITKSVTSALIGIAIDKGYISGVEAPLKTFFPRYMSSFDSGAKGSITIRDILTLTSGLEWDEKSYSCCDPRNSECQMLKSDDWLKYVLDRPMAANTGEEWVYNTGSVHLLAGVIKNASGIHIDAFAEKHFLEPLSITEYEWAADPNGYPCAGGIGGGLKLKTRDLAKIGYLFMNQGRWSGHQVVPEKWITESTGKYMALPAGREFGYLWWHGSFTLGGRKLEHIFAAGYGGQSCHLVPDFDLVIVLTCWSQPQDADILGPLLMVYNAVVKDENELSKIGFGGKTDDK